MKRLFDIAVSASALTVLMPVLVATAVAVRVKLGSPVFYTQLRPGMNGELFRLIKFRSMTDERDADGHPAPNERRTTPFGLWMRSTSLDELPAFWNVLVGDMSVVGPRPLLPEYLALYDDEQRRRHEVRPGITGLAQVRGRNSLTWDEKFGYDIEYVDNASMWLDLRIILETIFKVIRRDGISSGRAIGMERFTGSAPTMDRSKDQRTGR